MTVKELKEHLENIDDSLEVIIEMVVVENGELVDRDELVDHIETNDKEFYLVGRREGMSEAKCLNCLLTERLHIKDNITNGDVIKALFPEMVINEEWKATRGGSIADKNGSVEMSLSARGYWWNAPYKGE